MKTYARNYGIIRQDLYHTTSNLDWVFTDLFKIRDPAFKRKEHGDSMSLTRSRFFTEHGVTKIVLNTDLLHLKGYIAHPVDELGTVCVVQKNGKHSGKHNYLFRHPVSNIKLPPLEKQLDLQIEYEERIYKPITNLGRYIRCIEFTEKAYDEYRYDKNLFEFLQKYPHINLKLVDTDKTYLVEDLDFIQYLDEYMLNNKKTVQKGAYRYERQMYF